MAIATGTRQNKGRYQHAGENAGRNIAERKNMKIVGCCKSANYGKKDQVPPAVDDALALYI